MADPITIYGTPVVQGVAYAPALWIRRPELPPESAPALPDDVREAEVSRFLDCANAVADSLMNRASKTTGQAADVLIVTSSLATDRAWTKDVSKRIRDGIPAIQAVMKATERFVVMFETAGGVMAERTTDLRDVRDRVIAHLQGVPEPGIPHCDYPFVLLADDLSPADTASLDPNLCVAIVTQLGGPTSHTSIISRQLAIPCIVAARQVDQIASEVPVLVDGGTGAITTGIDEAAALEKVRSDVARLELIRSWTGPAQTSDGVHVQLLANVQDGPSATSAHESSFAEGIGLMRTELAFLDHPTEPSVEEQARSYSQALLAWSGSKVVVRTLDAGSDKPVAYATLRDEPNPALGVRGIRINGIHPNVLANQLDAIAVAAMTAPDTDVWVMAPMIATAAEARWFAGLINERNDVFGVSLKAGVMVEVPATAILIDQIMEYVDFVSIGTNDLTQYTMAADRLSANLAEYSDPWQPAPLALIRKVVEAGLRLGKPVGVCGEAAADPLLACVLVGMGVTSLSMASSAISGVGAQLGQVSLEQCHAAADAVVGAFDGGDGRYRARHALGLE
ncbi:phosphoenolpyruvate--protein phosphotransferase [Schaalia turicensis]|uniref:Phosphoenolpyruvate-protein phosphotransferase n=1 Tax=Schaalia turicensis TaxID=131111 RepID=A0A2I1I423_9ACTO|nr:phosphoenolpyruvate--protein phosphotransferase [Schaalia turicensis]PKY65884.1 phosphoenolpyruvate--protein phosphotransferase [Schaalia turicensis]